MITMLHEIYIVDGLNDTAFLIAFGKNLKRLRKSKGYSQADLANDLGVEISQISRIERGLINTSIYNLYKISKILNIEVSDLFNIE